MGKNLKDHNSIRSNELYTARSQFNDSSFPVHNNYNQHDQVAETIKIFTYSIRARAFSHLFLNSYVKESLFDLIFSKSLGKRGSRPFKISKGDIRVVS